MNVQHQLNEYITNNLLTDSANGPIAPDENLLLSGMIDSLGIMQLVNYIEDSYGLEIEAEEVTISNFKTIQAITEFIAIKVQNSN